METVGTLEETRETREETKKESKRGGGRIGVEWKCRIKKAERRRERDGGMRREAARS